MMRRLLPLVAVGVLASVASCGGSEQETASTTRIAPTTTVATVEEEPGSDSEPFPADAVAAVGFDVSEPPG